LRSDTLRTAVIKAKIASRTLIDNVNIRLTPFAARPRDQRAVRVFYPAVERIYNDVRFGRDADLSGAGLNGTGRITTPASRALNACYAI
jgi:hypothetical protein